MTDKAARHELDQPGSWPSSTDAQIRTRLAPRTQRPNGSDLSHIWLVKLQLAYALSVLVRLAQAAHRTLSGMAAERVYAGLPISERKADRRMNFIRAGIDVFGRNGYANTSISDVCAAGGLSRRQFYEEFSNREDLLVAAYDFIQDRAENAVLKALAELRPPIEPAAAATTLLEVYLKSLTTAPSNVRVAHVEVVGVSDRVEQHRQERRARWAPLINQIIKTVRGPNAHLPGRPEMAATALIGAINSLAHEWSQADPQPPITEVVAVLRAVALGLIA